MDRSECDGISGGDGGERRARSGRRLLAAGVTRRGSWAVTVCGVALGALLLAPGPVSAATALPDGRAWELVSPPEKDGASITPLGFGIEGPSGGLVQSSESGDAVTYVADAPIEAEPEGNRAIEGTQVLSKRSSDAWSSKDIVTPKSKGEGIKAGEAQEYRAFSPDLGLGIVVPFGHLNRFQEPPLVSGVGSEELGIYRRHTTTCEAGPVGCFEPIVTPENVTGFEGGAKTAFGGNLEYLKATSDLAHVVFGSPLKLTSAAPSGEEAPEGLYEWSAEKASTEQLSFISVLPPAGKQTQGKPAGEPLLGADEVAQSQSARNAISSDGRRVFWTGIKVLAGEHTVRYLFMRDTTTNTTLKVNAIEEGCTCKESAGEKAEEFNKVNFQMANSDGSRVFFTDTEPLTSDSKLKPPKSSEAERPADLYVCEVIEKEGKPACKLTDLTASFTGPGAVVGEVLGGAADGSNVYFVANGAPAGGSQGGCTLPEEAPLSPESKCNLYVDHYDVGLQKWDEPKLVAVLSEEDFPDWGGGIFAGKYLWRLSARVSPSGEYLAFMSNSPLTGYDNRDLNPAAGEAKDEEVFVYDAEAATEPLRCASCNPNPAQRPTGVLDQLNAGEGLSLRVDPAAVWDGKWLAGSIPGGWTPLNSENEPPYQSRYLLDNGRLFFNSADALVAEDTNHRSETIGETSTQVGVEDVYEYEPAGVGGCAGPAACVALLSSGSSEQESAFMDASEPRTKGGTPSPAGGNDAFFFTSQKLVSTDPDTTFDIYDAHVCSAESPCITPPPRPAPPCGDEASCRTSAPGSQGFGSIGSETALAVSAAPKGQTLPSKTSTPKPLTKLAKALKACKKKYKHSKRKRAACERRARKTFGHKTTSHHKAAKK
jgi:hypothetical protein